MTSILLKLIKFKTPFLILLAGSIIFAIAKLYSVKEFYKKELQTTQEQIKVLKEEHKKELLLLQTKKELEVKALFRKKQEQNYLQELEEEIKKRDEQLNTVKKIYKKRGLDAKNKEPPSSCCTKLSF